MKTFAEKVIQFNEGLKVKVNIPEVEVLNPFRNKNTLGISSEFYEMFYNDSKPRTFMFGINPGRFGAGVTGLAFTDPINLENFCGIKTSLHKKPELSSQFIYKVIDSYGGVKAFYNKFFVTSISPLGFTKGGKNLNYYDIKSLQESLKPFILETIKTQINFGAFTRCAISIGGGKNYKYFSEINNKNHFFEQIIPLDHPRFVMQYRRKYIDDYVKKYLDVLKKCEALNNG